MRIPMGIPRNRSYEPELTPEGKKALTSLEVHANHDWNLTNLTTDELDAIEADVAALKKGRGQSEWTHRSLTSHIIQEARKAVHDERLRRHIEQENAIQEQWDRINTIIAAATTMELAAEQMEQAEAIEDRRGIIPRYPVDVLAAEAAQGMDDAQLASFAGSSERQAELVAGKNLNEYERAASVLEKNGGARGKRLARVLREEAEHFRDDLEAHRANAATARAELDARAKRAEDRRRAIASVAETTANVDELLARVADLEARLAGKSEQ